MLPVTLKHLLPLQKEHTALNKEPGFLHTLLQKHRKAAPTVAGFRRRCQTGHCLAESPPPPRPSGSSVIALPWQPKICTAGGIAAAKVWEARRYLNLKEYSTASLAAGTAAWGHQYPMSLRIASNSCMEGVCRDDRMFPANAAVPSACRLPRRARNTQPPFCRDITSRRKRFASLYGQMPQGPSKKKGDGNSRQSGMKRVLPYALRFVAHEGFTFPGRQSQEDGHYCY